MCMEICTPLIIDVDKLYMQFMDVGKQVLESSTMTSRDFKVGNNLSHSFDVKCPILKIRIKLHIAGCFEVLISEYEGYN